MTTKRAYKLQEFVAHSSSVNCLKIGRRTSRVLVTGGEDHKVNLWSIGKPNAILSLSGHTSAVESVNFDSSEVLVAAGAANGSIKLWDLEEAKIVRTLTGHRSNCISVDFHPFGEFFASGSSDTNLKIWDIRRKGCIHTFKGHTRGVNAIRFTPDGRWVVSGGEDNCVKLWDLTAGKLLHDFKCHEGQIQCIDFHPHEFLLATGSADRTVKFWDLETFELIGSAGPETTGVRTMTFNPDGRTLLCGLHESLKVFSWEPIICHDAVDVGWSRLSDLKIHEGKLLGCSYNQSCVGVWVVDISLIEPYAISSPAISNGLPELKSTTSGNLHLQTDNSIKANMGSLSVSQNSNTVIKETKTVASTGSIPCTPQRIGLSSGPKMTAANAATSPGVTTLKRSSSKTHGTVNLQIFNRSDVAPVMVPRSSSNVEPVSDSREETGSGRGLLYTTQSKLTDFPNLSNSRDDLTDVRKLSNSRDDSTDVRKLSDSRDDSTDIRKISHSKDDLTDFRKLSNSRDDSTDFQKFSSSRGNSTNFQKLSNSRDDFTDFRKLSNSRDDLERAILNIQSGSMGSNNTESNEVIDQNYLSALNGVDQPTAAGERNLADVRCIGARKLGVNLPTEPSPSHQHENNDVRLNKPRNTCSVDVQRGGRTRSLVASWERRECSPIYEGPTPSNSSETMSAPNLSFTPRRLPASAETETESAGDEDFIADIMEQHRQFLTTAQSRLSKLQVVYRLWKRKDVRGVINAMEKMSDHAVAADVVSVLIAKSDSVTLDICTCLLPLLISLLESTMDRHLGISLEMLLKLVKIYGPVIHSTISATPSVGIDLQAEQRLERCNLCFIELEKVKHSLPSLTRRGGSIAKSAQELNLSLQEVL